MPQACARRIVVPCGKRSPNCGVRRDAVWPGRATSCRAGSTFTASSSKRSSVIESRRDDRAARAVNGALAIVFARPGRSAPRRVVRESMRVFDFVETRAARRAPESVNTASSLASRRARSCGDGASCSRRGMRARAAMVPFVHARVERAYVRASWRRCLHLDALAPTAIRCAQLGLPTRHSFRTTWSLPACCECRFAAPGRLASTLLTFRRVALRCSPLVCPARWRARRSRDGGSDQADSRRLRAEPEIARGLELSGSDRRSSWSSWSASELLCRLPSHGSRRVPPRALLGRRPVERGR